MTVDHTVTGSGDGSRWPGWCPSDGTDALGIADGQVAVLLVDLSPDAKRPPADLLTTAEHTRAARMRKPGSADAFITCRSTLRLVLGMLLKEDASRIAIETSEAGRPFVARSGVDFNVSHSGRMGLIALAAANWADVGVDVEIERPVADMERIVKRYFAPSDEAAFRAAELGHRTDTFFRGWVRAEAMLKADGAGVGSVAITPFVAFEAVDLCLPAGRERYYAAVARRRWSGSGGLAERLVTRQVDFPIPASPSISSETSGSATSA